MLISFYARGARGGSIELHEVERLVTNCRFVSLHPPEQLANSAEAHDTAGVKTYREAGNLRDRSFRIHLRSDFLWQELEGGLCSQSLVR